MKLILTLFLIFVTATFILGTPAPVTATSPTDVVTIATASMDDRQIVATENAGESTGIAEETALAAVTSNDHAIAQKATIEGTTTFTKAVTSTIQQIDFVSTVSTPTTTSGHDYFYLSALNPATSGAIHKGAVAYHVIKPTCAAEQVVSRKDAIAILRL